MLIFKYLNQPQNELQKEFIKQVQNSDLNKYIDEDTETIYKIKFLKNGQVWINKDKIDIKYLKDCFEKFETNLINFLKQISEDPDYQTIWLDFEPLMAKPLWDLVFIQLIIKFHGKLTDYSFLYCLWFDPDETIVNESKLIINYFKYVIKQCDDLLMPFKAKLNKEEIIEFDTGQIIPLDDEDDYWLEHSGLCWDFETPILSLINEDTEDQKRFDYCNSGLVCQIIQLANYLKERD